MVEQLVASGVKYVFNNPGSREGRFLDALHSHPGIDQIVALHEGSVASMAGGYTQAKLEPAAMVVHLGAGLAQSLGQLINVAEGGLPVVVITFAGDTGSYFDKIGMELNHSFGPTSISAPFTKSTWTVLEPEGLAQAIDRAFKVATTAPVGPVHLAMYDRLLGPEEVETSILESRTRGLRAGYPDDADLEELERALRDAERPLLYLGDGVWKSGAQAQAAALAERFGLPVCGDLRSLPIKHPLHCGPPYESLASLEADTIVCIGVRHMGTGFPEAYVPASMAQRVIAIGSDVQNLKNIQDVDLAILADERRTLERFEELTSGRTAEQFDERRTNAREMAAALRARRLKAAQDIEQPTPYVRPSVVPNALDEALERKGGGLVMIEQFVTPITSVGGTDDPGRNVYIYAAGGSEGYGIGGTIGLKLGAPESRVVGLIGDGSLFYSDSALWTAAHHEIPVLYVIPNNQAYGVVANAFSNIGGSMKNTGEYGGLALEGIDPVKLAEGFGMEAMTVSEESRLGTALDHGLSVVDDEQRPFLLDVRLPLGLPNGGRPAPHFRLSGK